MLKTKIASLYERHMSNHHRGSYTSPALAATSYLSVDLPPESTLVCKMLPANKLSEKLFPFGGWYSIMKSATNKNLLSEKR